MLGHFKVGLLWLGAVLPYPCKFVFFSPNDNYASYSERRALYKDLMYVNAGNKIEAYTSWEFRNCNFQ